MCLIDGGAGKILKVLLAGGWITHGGWKMTKTVAENATVSYRNCVSKLHYQVHSMKQGGTIQHGSAHFFMILFTCRSKYLL